MTSQRSARSPHTRVGPRNEDGSGSRAEEPRIRTSRTMTASCQSDLWLGRLRMADERAMWTTPAAPSPKRRRRVLLHAGRAFVSKPA